ncbi:lamina-associated polypeptide 2-like [Ahaetulla prasina]|uniref:lamina-associated polypeptide 2-like n=1 Tax=Ahaetulla prasina TaxID=499056 RepID=UPI0026477683|nr:lamina-associated polypeptide 2-like [Ahaetulla prasina]
MASVMGDDPEREELQSQLDSISPAQSIVSQHSFLEELERADPDLSEDEGLLPEQPAFTSLFPPNLFKSLLFKAKNVAQLGSSSAQSVASSSKDASDLVFSEPAHVVDTIPAPGLFIEVVKRQWSAPSSSTIPTSADKRFFNVDPDLSSVLQTPTVDVPVAALSASSSISGQPEEGLRPEDRRTEQVLQRAHQGSAWAIRSASSAFFNRPTLLWLRQLQEKLPAGDTRIHQDLNKIIAAVQFSADATLHSMCFASKSMASALTARRLLWLRQRQANVRHKWRLASAPFAGEFLFGAALEPLLIETKDKRKVLPIVHRRGDSRFHPFSLHPSFRSSDWEGQYFQVSGLLAP